MGVAVEGEWTAQLSGGCPKFESWHQNPQFQLWSVGGSYTLELRQHAQPALGQIGLWVMLADSADGRAQHIKPSSMVGKTKFKATEQQVLNVDLPQLQSGLPYIVVCATFEPGDLGRFTLRAVSTEDDAPRLVPLQPPPAGPPATMVPSQATAQPLVGADAAADAGVVSGPPPSGEPVIEVEGQGLSTKLEAALATMVNAVVQQCTASGEKYEDAEFPAERTSLAADEGWPHAGLVADWRRLPEVTVPDGAATGEGSYTGGRLFKSSWEVGGVRAGPLSNIWYLEALNVVAGDSEVTSLKCSIYRPRPSATSYHRRLNPLPPPP